MRGSRNVAFGFAAALALVGCGQPSELDRVKLVPVEGKLSVKGSPVTAGTLSFRPNTAKGNQTPFQPAAEIGSDGSYRLKTATRNGAPTGWYTVILACAVPSDPNNAYAPPKHLVNPKYATVETSDLHVEVVEGASPGVYDLKVQP